MKVAFNVLKGPAPAEPMRFEGDEATNILVGRDDVKSDAEWRLSREDRYVSRSHFMLEIRPPNCQLSDPLSLNGTYLRRGDKPEQRVEEILLEDGDQIRVGHTVLGIEIEVPQVEEEPWSIGEHTLPFDSLGGQTLPDVIEEPAPEPEVEPKQKPQPKAESKPVGKAQPEMMCIRCGKPLLDMPSLVASNLRNEDFMCAECRAAVKSKRERGRKAAKRARAHYHCARCNTDVSARADQDGRATELRDVSFYLCERCAERTWQEASSDSKHSVERNKEIGGYHLLSLLGKGGMGEVYKAWHKETGRVVALKCVLPIVKGNQRMLQRFHREMGIMQELQHANLVRLFESGQYGKYPFFISEFVTGGDLLQFVSDNGVPKLSPEEVVNVIADALVGLDFFHNQAYKYVHRDIKPENILVVRNNGSMTAKIADFGLARSYERHGGTITRTGEYAGTIMYMPPEQFTAFKGCKPPVDVYAMGVTTYYLLTGQLPLGFPPPWKMKKSSGPVRLRKSPIKIAMEDPRTPILKHRRGLPARLARVVDKSVKRDERDRYQTAEAFRDDLLGAIH